MSKLIPSGNAFLKGAVVTIVVLAVVKMLPVNGVTKYFKP